MKEQSRNERDEENYKELQELTDKLKLGEKEWKKEWKKDPNRIKYSFNFKDQLTFLKQDLRKGLQIFYFCLFFVGFAWAGLFLKGLIKSEVSFSPFEQITKTEDLLTSIFMILGYLNLLFFLFFLSYEFLYIFYYFRINGNYDKNELWEKLKKVRKQKSILFSTWFVTFFFIFHKSIFSFINNMPGDIWNGWLIGMFLIFSVLVAIAILKKR